MFEHTTKPIREHLRERLAALAALQSASSLASRHQAPPPGGAPPGSPASVDYQVVLEQLELEAVQAITAAAAELRKPSVGDLIERLWQSGPLTFQQIRASIVETEAPSGQIETLLNRLHNAGLLEASSGPTPATDAVQQDAVTLSPLNRLGVEGEARPSVIRAEGDVTSTYSSLITSKGREWFNDQAKVHGIDLGERINCQF